NVPNFLAYSDKSENAFLLLEWIEGNKSADTEEMLGRKLAQFHQVHATMHGFQEDTYIGLLKQPNKLRSEERRVGKECRSGCGAEQLRKTDKQRSRKGRRGR